MGFGLITCGGVEDVVSVLTLVRRGAAQVCRVLRVEELREQLEVEEEDVESGEVESRRVRHVEDHGWRCEMRSELEPCGVRCDYQQRL